MNRTLDTALDVMDAALLDAARNRLQIALTSARHIADSLLSDELGSTAVRYLEDEITELLSELEVAVHAADAIRQAAA